MAQGGYQARKYEAQASEDGMNRLKAALKARTPGKLWFFYGEEEYLKAWYFESLKKLVLDGPAEEFNYHRFNQDNLSMDALADAVDALPMMAEYSMVRIDDYDPYRDSEDNRARIAALLSDIPDYCCLVFYYTAVPFRPDRRQKKLTEAIESNGVQVEFVKQQERELVGWIQRRFKSLEKAISRDDAAYLVFITDGLMNTLIGNIEIISAFSEEPVITREDIDAVVEPVLSAVVFDITDQLAGGSFGKALTRLQQVLKKGEEPLTVLGAISAQFRRMRAAKLLRADGGSADDLCRLCGIRDFAAKKIMSAADRVTLEFCSRAVVLCGDTDLKIKSSFENPGSMLELLLLQLSEEAS